MDLEFRVWLGLVFKGDGLEFPSSGEQIAMFEVLQVPISEDAAGCIGGMTSEVTWRSLLLSRLLHDSSAVF